VLGTIVSIAHPGLQPIQQIRLATRDAHEFYRQYGGIVSLPAPEKWMIRWQTQIIRPATAGGSDATRANDPGR
jgi:hypothetical protein